MALTNDDLKKIEKLVNGSVGGAESRLINRIDQVETKLTKKIDGVESKLTNRIDQVETKLTNKINSVETGLANLSTKLEDTKEEILDVLGREISDLADINRAVITRTDEIDYRLRIVERKLGLVSHK